MKVNKNCYSLYHVSLLTSSLSFHIIYQFQLLIPFQLCINWISRNLWVFSRNRDISWSSRTCLFTSGGQSRLVTIDLLNLFVIRQPGVVAHACNPVTWRLGSLNGLRAGFLGVVVLCRSGVRAKFGVNIVNTEKSEFSRLVEEEQTSPGWKHSRQKFPRQTVVG